MVHLESFSFPIYNPASSIIYTETTQKKIKGRLFSETENLYRKRKGPRLDLEGYLTQPEDMTDFGGR